MILSVVNKHSDGEIYCEKDYADLFSPKCPKCKQPIQGAAIEIEGTLYHKACFACYGCKKEISVGDEYMNIDQCTFHTGKELHSHTLHALDCFKCKNCKSPIGEQEFAGTGEFVEFFTYLPSFML